MIKFQDVTKEYSGGTVALKNVNLTIDDGEFVFVIGHSGAGKSTFAKLLICEERVTSGKIFVDDFNLSKLPDGKIARLRRTMGIVFQEFRLFNDKNVFENVAFAMRVVGEPEKAIVRRVPYVLDLVGLKGKEKRFPDQLSGGEQQRVAFARAIANNPRIIIADEPTGNIDPEMSGELVDLLIRLNKLGKTVIAITHEKAIVDYYRKRVIKFSGGIITSDRSGGTYNEEEI